MSKFNGSYIPKSAMTIFAHPDDSEFTIGGTIAKWAAAGCEITMVLCTSGNVGTHDPKYTLKTLAKTRETEQKAVADFFGVKHVVFLRHDDCALEPSLDVEPQSGARNPQIQARSGDLRRSRRLVLRHRLHQSSRSSRGGHRGAGIGFSALRDGIVLAGRRAGAQSPCRLHPRRQEVRHRDRYFRRRSTQKVGALKLHQSQLGDWDPTEMITQWAQEEAKAARKRAKKKGQKAKADDGGKLQYAEAYRVMTLVDQPQES